MLKTILSQSPKLLSKPVPFSTFSPASHQTELIKSVINLLIHHRSRTRWSGLRSLMSSKRLNPSQVSQVSLALKSKPNLALRFVHFTLTHPTLFSHDMSSFATLTHVLARARLKSAACHCMRLALLSSDSYNYPSPPMKFFELLVKSYRECESAPFVFDLLLITCSEMRKIDESIEIMRRLRSCGISPQIDACNRLISWAVKLKGSHEGYLVFKEVFGGEEAEATAAKKKSIAVRPNVHSFNPLMEGFHRDGNVETMEEVWRIMETSEVVPNGYTYSMFINVLCEEGRIDEIESVWDQMRDRGIEPDLVGYNTMIGAFCLFGKMQRAEEVYREMRVKGITGSSATYEHLVKGYCDSSDVDSGMLIYKLMNRRGFTLQGSTISKLIELLCEGKRVCEAMEIRKTAIGDGCSNLSRRSYEFLIKALCDEEKMEDALKIQAEMVGKGYCPDRNIYGFFVAGYEKMGNEEMAAILRHEMQETFKRQE